MVKDKLFYFDSKLDQYVSLGAEEYDKIISGHIRLWFIYEYNEKGKNN